MGGGGNGGEERSEHVPRVVYERLEDVSIDNDYEL